MGGNKKWTGLLAAFLLNGGLFGGASYVAVKGIDYLLSPSKKSASTEEVAEEKKEEAKDDRKTSRAPASFSQTPFRPNVHQEMPSPSISEDAGHQQPPSDVPMVMDNSGGGFIGAPPASRPGPAPSPVSPVAQKSAINSDSIAGAPLSGENGASTAASAGTSVGTAASTTPTPAVSTGTTTPTSPSSTSTASSIGSTAGGAGKAVSGGGFKASISLGAPTNAVSSVSGGGFKLKLNTQAAGF